MNKLIASGSSHTALQNVFPVFLAQNEEDFSLKNAYLYAPSEYQQQ